MDVYDALSDDPRKLRGFDYVNYRLSRKTTTEINKFQAKHIQGKKDALLDCLNDKKAITDTEAETTLKKIRSKFIEVKSHDALVVEDNMPYPCDFYYTEEEERRAKEENPKYLYESNFVANKVLLENKKSLAKVQDLNFALQLECGIKQQYGSDNTTSQDLEIPQNTEDSLDIKELSTGFNGLLSREVPEIPTYSKQSKEIEKGIAQFSASKTSSLDKAKNNVHLPPLRWSEKEHIFVKQDMQTFSSDVSTAQHSFVNSKFHTNYIPPEDNKNDKRDVLNGKRGSISINAEEKESFMPLLSAKNVALRKKTGTGKYLKRLKWYSNQWSSTQPSLHILSNAKSRHLVLSYRHIIPETARAIADLLSRNEYIQYLDFRVNESMGDVGASYILGALKYNRTLTQLNLTKCGVSNLAIQELAEALGHNYTLREIFLGSNDIDDYCLSLFCAPLANTSKSLKLIDIQKNKITPKSGPTLATIVRNSSYNLKSLNLSWNRLGKEGGENLMHGIMAMMKVMKASNKVPVKAALRSLDLSWCSLHDDVAGLLSKILSDPSSSLTHVSLSHNPKFDCTISGNACCCFKM